MCHSYPNRLEAFESWSSNFGTLIILKLWNPSHLEAFKPLVLKLSSPLSQSVVSVAKKEKKKKKKN